MTPCNKVTGCRPGYGVAIVSELETSELPFLIERLKKLWVLELLVEEGTFQKAASKARVTRSAISQTLSSLEKLYSKPLVVRNRGEVRATPFGAEILNQVRPILASLEILQPMPKIANAPKMTWLDLGAYESLAVALMPGLIKRLESQCPGIRIKIRVGRTALLATLVRKGELCMAVVIDNGFLDDLNVVSVAEDRLGLYIREPGCEGLPIGALAGGTDGQTTFHTRFLKALAISKKIGFSSDSLEAVLAATEQGSIAGVLPTRVAARAKQTLLEITPRKVIEQNLSSHRICLISQKNCDPAETIFLADEIRRLM